MTRWPRSRWRRPGFSAQSLDGGGDTVLCDALRLDKLEATKENPFRGQAKFVGVLRPAFCNSRLYSHARMHALSNRGKCTWYQKFLFHSPSSEVEVKLELVVRLLGCPTSKSRGTL